MDLDLWTSDFQLAMEWELETSAFQVNADGQLGDLKPTVDKDTSYNLQPEGIPYEIEGLSGEDVLGSKWMETSDLSAFFDALGDDHTLESTMVEPNSVPSYQLSPTFDVSSFLEQNPGENVLQNQLDCFLSPPESPEQVAPALGLQPATSTDNQSIFVLTDFSPDTSVVMVDDSVSAADMVNFVNVCSNDSFNSICDYESSLSETLNSDSSPSFSSPSSPNTSQSAGSSIILSSPELYKVISTSAVTERFSPYSHPKAKESTKKTVIPKAPRRTKNPAQPVPEHIIMKQVNKKDRKKLQNKNAAIRYRMKKKEESTIILSEENELEEKNLTLRTKVDDLQREIKYMKSLMQDVLKAQGVKIE